MLKTRPNLMISCWPVRSYGGLGLRLEAINQVITLQSWAMLPRPSIALPRDSTQNRHDLGKMAASARR